MAVSGVSSSRSIYGTRNVITGLASGMDTESMIENAISGYKSKISSLTQQRTKIEWQQEAYRSIITKMAAFTSKYADYQSSTNLMSPSFFNQAVKTVAQGANASKVSASGKTGSSIQINAVRQMAKNATYRVSGAALGGKTANTEKVTATASGSFYLDGEQKVSNVSGKLSIAYGGSDARSYLDISFGELDNFKDAQEMADHINKQLSEQSITTSSGKSKPANEMLKAEVGEDGNIKFVDASGSGNEVYISSASGKLKNTLNVQTGSGVTAINTSSLDHGSSSVGWSETMNTQKYLEGAEMEITLDGVTKKVAMPTKEEILAELDKNYAHYDSVKWAIESDTPINGAEARQKRDEAYVAALQKNIDKKFGTLSDGTSKLKVSDAQVDEKAGTESDAVKGIQLSFEAQPGSTFKVGGEKATAMGMSADGTSSYMSVGTATLGDILDDKQLGEMKEVIDEQTGEAKTDSNGNKLYAFMLNGEKIGEFSKDTAIGTIMTKINSNKNANVSVSYSKSTNEFTFTAKDGGMAGEIDFGDGIASALFGDTSEGMNSADGKMSNGGTYTKGQDAIFEAEINGRTMTLTRSSNTVDLDGMTVTLKGEFGYKKDDDGNLVMENGNPVRDTNSEAVTFSSSADADKIVDAIKSMVNDYNEMASEIKSAYSTLPMQQSSGKYYEPLTDEDMEEMSDKAIENWNEKAKTGVLFGDRDLASLYQQITKAVSMTGADGEDLKAAGITVNYANGLTTLALDENKLRATLETDPDRVTEIFTKSTSSGATSKGFLEGLKEPLDLYGKTTGVNLKTGTKGVLVEKAGHALAPSSMYTNVIQKQLDKIDQEITKWQDKMTDRVDYYTNKFSQLEQLIAQMNSQSSSIAGLMGNMG